MPHRDLGVRETAGGQQNESKEVCQNRHTRKAVWDKWPSKKRDKLRRLYLQLRTYYQTSKAFGCSERTVKRYAEAYGWKDDLAEQDRRVQAMQDERAVQERFNALKLVEDKIEALARDYADAEPGSKPQIASAMAQLVKSRELLLGRPTERTEEIKPLAERLEERYVAHIERVRIRERRRKELEGGSEAIEAESEVVDNNG